MNISACYYDVEEELYPMMNCDTSAISFESDIMPVFDANCMSCHNSNIMNGNVSLVTYSGVTDAISDGRLLGVIKHDPGYPPMPQGAPMLNDCTIAQIEKWINNGAPNN